MRAIVTLFLLFFTALGWAQTQHADSLFQKGEHRIDSIHSGIQYQSDSLKKVYKQKLSTIDSVNTSFHLKTDSVQQALNGKLAGLSTVGSSLEHKIDSLKSHNLPTEKYTHKLDSVNQVREKAVADANKKIQSLKAQTTDKLKTVQLPPELQSKVTDVTKNIDGFKLPGQEMNLPSIDNPLSKVGDVNLSSVKNLGEVGKLPELGGVGNELKDLQGNMKDVTNVTGEVGAYQKDIQNVTSGNLNEVKELPKSLETKAADLSGVGGLQGETKSLDQYKDQLGKVQNPDAMKQEAVQQVQQAAINHFAGKEQVLQQAMDKMAKYKKKYSSLQSLSEIGKRRPNPMHGKPLVERLLPGIGLQIFRRKDLLIDFNPFIGYRLTERLTSGIGWNQRLAYNDKHHQIHVDGHGMVFGPRMYSEFNLFKGFFPRFELEAMNTYVPTLASHYTSYEQNRQWVWSAFIGMKKNYRFLKHVNGYTAIMVNLYNPLHRSPYGDIVNMRIGFEFPMKKKPAKASTTK